MATATRAIRSLSTAYRKFTRDRRFGFSTTDRQCREPRWQFTPRRKAGKVALGILVGFVGGCSAILYFLNQSVEALGNSISLPRYPWSFNNVFKTFDHAALRRGWLVYRTVCRTCHSLKYVRFLDLIDVTHTLEEVKALAAEFEIEDGPDQEGNPYTRPGSLTDMIPDPYPNEQAARAANFGAYPVDLTYVILARKNGANYLFSLLTGWMDPPAGVQPAEGQYFNVYFPGGNTTMAQMFFPDVVEYEDGTPATESQMAKDVVEFLSWTAAPEHDTRKIMTLKGIGIAAILLSTMTHLVRRHSAHMKSRQVAYVPKRGC